MANKMQIKRGNKANLPTLSDGEFGFCKDTNELFIGNGGVNHPVAVTGGTNYLKFDDGTMIEWGSKAFGTLNIGAAWGSLYISDSMSFDDFSEPFVSTPVVTVSLNPTESSTLFLCKYSQTTKTNPGTYKVCTAVQGGGTSDLHLTYIAVGRWKA